MIAVNPQVVRLPDGRFGCIVARHGLKACVQIGRRRILETHNLVTLSYHFTLEPPAPGKRQRRLMRDV